MRRQIFMLVMLVAMGSFLAGCHGDQPTGLQDETAPTTVGDDVGKGTLDGDRTADPRDRDRRRERDRDDDGDEGREGDRDRDEIPELPPPDQFVTGIDNPYLAFAAGKVFRYEGETEDGLETIVVEVTAQTKTILGVVTTVVHDQAFLDGELIEDTFDWFAQDEDGNVWYFGEDSRQIENGQVVSTEGSWEAGVDGAEPGIIMLADPEVGDRYQQENAEGVAEDRARVVSLDARVRVEFGRFRGVLATLETTPLEPGAREFKFYEPGVGLLLEATRRDGGGERIELVAIEP
jgi:hypothetical protein